MDNSEVQRSRSTRIGDHLELFWRSVVVMAIAFMACAVLWQIAARHFHVPSTSALVELVQYAFSIATFGGAALLFRRREHLAIGFVVDAVPTRWRLVLIWASDLVTITVLALFVLLGVEFTRAGMAQYSPVLGIPVGWVYLTAALALASALWFAVEARLHGAPKKVEGEQLPSLDTLDGTSRKDDIRE